MKIYLNFHNSGGGVHLCEFTETVKEAGAGAGKPQWHYRLRWEPNVWKALSRMTATIDGEGTAWGQYDGKPVFRLVPVTKTTQWPGAEYPKPQMALPETKQEPMKVE